MYPITKEDKRMVGANEIYGSYEEMYKEHHEIIYRYVRRIIHNNEEAVEDLTQEVFFVAYKKWDILKVHPNIPGFLMVVAQNKIKKWFEKQSRFHFDDEGKMDRLSGDDKVTETDAFKMVDYYSSIEHTLSDKDLDILRHYYEYGYTSSEMAKRLGITESCFKVRVARMKQKLKNSIMVLAFLAFFLEIGTLS